MEAKKKLSTKDWGKIRARYDKKREEFEPLELEKLKEMWNTTKMSSTDRIALEYVVQCKLEPQAKADAANLKTEENGTIQGEGEE